MANIDDLSAKELIEFLNNMYESIEDIKEIHDAAERLDLVLMDIQRFRNKIK